MDAPAGAQGGVKAIGAGKYYTVAAKDDGTVLAWGLNDFGQATVPESLAGAIAISVGYFHTAALIGTGAFLKARPGDNEIILSWSTNAVGFILQSAPDLTSPVTWTDSPAPPAILGAQFTVTNSLSHSAQFYRLRQP